MNIKKELRKAQFKNNVRSIINKAINVIRTFMCQHKNCASEIITITLGNTKDSIIAELVGEDNAANNSYTVKIRKTYCLNCGRELYRTFLDE